MDGTVLISLDQRGKWTNEREREVSFLRLLLLWERFLVLFKVFPHLGKLFVDINPGSGLDIIIVHCDEPCA